MDLVGHGSVVKTLINSAEWVRFLLTEKVLHNWEKISHGGKNATTSNSASDSCIPFPGSSVKNFRSRNERREARREGSGTAGEERYEGSEVASLTELYLRHPGAHVHHANPTQLTLRTENYHSVALRTVLTSRTLRTVVTLRY
jgi:hypothetical protein